MASDIAILVCLGSTSAPPKSADNGSGLEHNFDSAVDRASLHIADRLRVRGDYLFDFGVGWYGLGWLPSPCEDDLRPMRLDLRRRFARAGCIEFITRRRSVCLVNGYGLCTVGKAADLAEKDICHLIFA